MYVNLSGDKIKDIAGVWQVSDFLDFGSFKLPRLTSQPLPNFVSPVFLPLVLLYVFQHKPFLGTHSCILNPAPAAGAQSQNLNPALSPGWGLWAAVCGGWPGSGGGVKAKGTRKVLSMWEKCWWRRSSWYSGPAFLLLAPFRRAKLSLCRSS